MAKEAVPLGKKERLYRLGFTLVELLIVVSIISLLSSIAMSRLSTARIKARDTQRKQNLHQIRLALELYRDTNGRYPIIDTDFAISNSGGGSVSATQNTNWLALQTALSPFLQTLPLDPRNSGTVDGPWWDNNFRYAYRSDSAGAVYDLIGQLEGNGDALTCSNRCWKRYTAGGANWCSACGGTWSNNLFADH